MCGLQLTKCSDCFRFLFILCNIIILVSRKEIECMQLFNMLSVQPAPVISFMQLVGFSSIGVGTWQIVLDNTIGKVFTEVDGKITGGLFNTNGGLITIIFILGVLGAYRKSALLSSIVSLQLI